jgi:Immunity protein 7
MLNYNGWVQIHMNVDDDLDNIDHSDLTRFFAEIEPHISDFNKYSNRFIEYKEFSWTNNYFIFGMHNHVLTYLDDLMALFETIGKKAPGSFGLLYVRLPEDPIYWNKYRVFRLAKGVVTEHEDTLLSPCRPTIED